MPTRSEISKKAWRARKRRGGKGKCAYCHHPIYVAGVVSGGRKYHKTCLASHKAGLTRKQAGVANPRPPASWFSQMSARVAAHYPRERGESIARYRKSISRIVGGVWYNFSEATRKRLIRKYD